MKDFVSLNFKYYKDSNVTGVLGHINRQFKVNKNAYINRTKNNFGDSGLISKYQQLRRKVEITKGKSIRKDATTLLDGVLVFSLEQFENLEKSLSQNELQEALTLYTREYMQKIKKLYGLEPLGFQFHLDEGHIKNKFVRNVHAHLTFYNYDFKTNKSRWRELKRKDFSKMQDMAGTIFSDLGFRRGKSKEMTKKNHLKKDKYIEQKQNKIVENNKTEIKELELQISELELSYKQKVIQLKRKFKRLLAKISTYTLNLLNSAEKVEKKSIRKNTEKLVKCVDEISETDLTAGLAVAEQVKTSIKNSPKCNSRKENYIFLELEECEKLSKHKTFTRYRKNKF